MGQRGPLPRPAARRRNQRPVRGTVTTGRPAMPRDLSGEAREEWKRTVAVLEEMGVLHRVDRSLLLRYCRAWAEWQELDEQLARTGKLVRGQKGNLVRNPLWLLRRDAGQDLLALAVQLGLSPMARLRNGIRHEPPAAREPEGLTALEEYRRALQLGDAGQNFRTDVLVFGAGEPAKASVRVSKAVN
jgi:P27 family predicted phage terminase small subunit